MKKAFFMQNTAFFAIILCLLPFVSADLTSNAFFYYTLDNSDITGTTLIDLVGNNNATFGGWTTGVSAGCIIPECVTGTNGGNANITSAPTENTFTLSMWTNSADTTDTDVIIGPKTSGAADKTIQIYYDSGNLVARIHQDSSTYIGRVANGEFRAGLQHIVVTYDGGTSSSGVKIYVNGTQTDDADSNGGSFGAWNKAAFMIGGQFNGQGIEGQIDEVYFIGRNLSSTEVTDLYNENVAGNQYPFSGGGGSTYAFVQVRDLYDNATIQGLNVTVGTSTNVTDASGIAHIYNPTGLNYTVNGAPLYFDVSGTASENDTVTTYVYGAQLTINATDLLNTRLENFTITPTQTRWENTSTLGELLLILKPNTTNTVNIAVYDGNDTLQTYANNTINISTSPRDASNYTITGVYQTVMTINVSIGSTSAQISNFTANITGLINESKNTTSYKTTHYIMNGNYTITVEPVGYSINSVNVTINLFNFTPEIVVPAYALNSFYLNLLDEITSSAITETMTIELISEATAGIYNTSNGSIALELLTPADYTIRYRSTTGTNYTERDYYQTLVNNNYYDLSLYGILNAESTDLLVTVKTTGGDPVEDATVKLLRYYPSCNCYNVVEMAKTSYAGEAFFYADAYDAHYKFTVDYEGSNYFVSTSPENLVPTTTGLITRTIIINLGDAYFQSFRNLENVGRTLTYNNATNALSFTWSDAGGLVTSGCLYASYLDGVHYTAVTPACANGSTGSVVLSLNTSQRSYKYYAEVETSTTYSAYTLFSGTLDKIAKQLFSGRDSKFGAFIAGGVMIGLALMFSYSAIAVLIITSVSTIFMSILGIAPLQTTFITGFATIVIGMAAYLMRS